jgi:purine-binding chemotaxis protein CheW
MTPTEYTTNTCIIVLDIDMDGESIHVGALVDAVQAVLEIDKNGIMPPPSIGSKYKSDFIEGVANIDDKFIMILNMDAVFSADEIINMKDKTEETEKAENIEEIG